MKTFLISQTLLLSAALVAATEFPRLPEPEFADTEVSTNLPFSFPRGHVGQFAFELEFAATASNNVEVAFGEDVDANGVLDPGEADFVFGWDCGEWRIAGTPDREAYSADAATNGVEKAVSWRLRLVGGARPRRLSVTENGLPLFAELSGEPPAWFFRREWNAVRVTARGVYRPDETFSVAVLPDSFILRLR